MKVSRNKNGGKFDGSFYDYGPYNYNYMPRNGDNYATREPPRTLTGNTGHYRNGWPMYSEQGASDNEEYYELLVEFLGKDRALREETEAKQLSDFFVKRWGLVG